MTNPIESIIPRELHPDLGKKLNHFSAHIDELVNFGAIILKWELEKTISDEDLPTALFLRNFLEQIDGVSILIKSSSVEPSKNLLRTALENLLYLEYLLEKETYNRSMSFLVWNHMNNNKNLERLIPTTDEYKKIEVLFSKDKFLSTQKPLIYEPAEELLKIGNAILSSTKYQPFKTEYDKTKLKHKNNMSWYSLFGGPTTIKKLAEHLNQEMLYDGFFRSFSASTHGTDILHGKMKSNNEGELGILQIRNSENSKMITQNCYNLCLMLFRVFITNKLPDKMTDYNGWNLGIQSINNNLMQQY